MRCYCAVNGCHRQGLQANNPLPFGGTGTRGPPCNSTTNSIATLVCDTLLYRITRAVFHARQCIISIVPCRQGRVRTYTNHTRPMRVVVVGGARRQGDEGPWCGGREERGRGAAQLRRLVQRAPTGCNNTCMCHANGLHSCTRLHVQPPLAATLWLVPEDTNGCSSTACRQTLPRSGHGHARQAHDTSRMAPTRRASFKRGWGWQPAPDHECCVRFM